MNSNSLFIKAKVTAFDPNQDGVAVSSTTTYYSKLISGNHSTSKALHVYWVGTNAGTLTYWESDKEQPSLTDDADWKRWTDFPVTNPAGADGSFRAEITGRSARWSRLKYVNASGSGTLYGRATSQGS